MKKIRKRKGKQPKPPLIVSVKCGFCSHKPDIEVTSLQREGATLLCYEHVGPFFAIWTGKATEFNVVKL